jgi:hypothetical protein
MHGWYQLFYYEKGKRRGLALVEARNEAHARELGIALGATSHELRLRRLEPSPKRPLQRRFADCPHCQFLKESGL